MKHIKLTTLTALAFITGNLFSAPVTQYLKLNVTDNSNVSVQQTFSLLYSFSSIGTNALDANDVGNQYSIGNPGNDVYPFSLSSNSDIITSVDARPDLASYKRIQIGFLTKFPATIKIVCNAFGNSPDSTNRPAYAWIEQISTGYVYPVLGDTVKLEIPANTDFTADFYLHTGPAIGTGKVDETCFHSYNGEVSVHNPNCTNWLVKIYHNSTLISSDSVFQADTTIGNLSAGNYHVVTSVNSIPVDSATFVIGGAAQIIPDFAIDNYNPTTDDTVTFTNVTSGATSYGWDFGDGNTDTLDNTSHRFLFAGNYEVVLTAMNEAGCVETVFDTIYVTTGSSDPEDFHPTIFNPSFNYASTSNPTGASFDSNTTTAPATTRSEFEIYASAERIVVKQSEVQVMNITILTTSGQVISTTETTEGKVELSVPANGIYIVRAVNTKGEFTSKTIMVAN